MRYLILTALLATTAHAQTWTPQLQTIARIRCGDCHTLTTPPANYTSWDWADKPVLSKPAKKSSFYEHCMGTPDHPRTAAPAECELFREWIKQQ